MLAWSPGTGGRPVQGDAIILTDQPSPQQFQQWLPQVRGKFVLASFPQPTCRARQSLGAELRFRQRSR